jgi:hypothetical protein
MTKLQTTVAPYAGRETKLFLNFSVMNKVFYYPVRTNEH